MRLPFDRNINPFFALLAVAVVGAGATLAITHAIALAASLGAL